MGSQNREEAKNAVGDAVKKQMAEVALVFVRNFAQASVVADDGEKAQAARRFKNGLETYARARDAALQVVEEVFPET